MVSHTLLFTGGSATRVADPSQHRAAPVPGAYFMLRTHEKEREKKGEKEKKKRKRKRKKKRGGRGKAARAARIKICAQGALFASIVSDFDSSLGGAFPGAGHPIVQVSL